MLNDVHKKVVELGLLKEGVNGESDFDLDISTNDETSDDDGPWIGEASDCGGAKEQEALQLLEVEGEGTGGALAGKAEFSDNI